MFTITSRYYKLLYVVFLVHQDAIKRIVRDARPDRVHSWYRITVEITDKNMSYQV